MALVAPPPSSSAISVSPRQLSVKQLVLLLGSLQKPSVPPAVGFSGSASEFFCSFRKTSIPVAKSFFGISSLFRNLRVREAVPPGVLFLEHLVAYLAPEFLQKGLTLVRVGGEIINRASDIVFRARIRATLY